MKKIRRKQKRMKNEIKISSFAYKPEERTTKTGNPITRFGMKVYNGKGADGKATYEYINCKYFGVLASKDGELTVIGKLMFDNWEKDGVKHKTPYIMVDRVEYPQTEKSKQTTDFTFDDDLPDFA